MSIPAPVYYADLVCGRAHTRYDPSKYGTFRSDNASQESSQDPDAVLQKYREDFKPLSGYAERAMYFSVSVEPWLVGGDPDILSSEPPGQGCWS